MRPVNNKRGRGRNGSRRGGGGANRNFESNGPDTKIRGTALQVYEKYCALARDAGANGDHIGAENYQQHAEHYYRIMIANSPGVAQQYARQNGHDDTVEGGVESDGGQRPSRVDPAEAEQPRVEIGPNAGD